MVPTDKRFIPLAPMGTTEPSKLSPKWMYSGLTRPEGRVDRPSMNGSDRAPEVDPSRSFSADGSSEGVEFPLRSTTTAGRRQRYRSVIEARWAWTKRHRKPLLLLILIGSMLLAVIAFTTSLTRHSTPAPVATSTPTSTPPPRPSPYFKAVVTWNNYTAQSGVVCGQKLPANSTYYGAAASDVSPDIHGGTCSQSIDLSICDRATGKPPSTYQAPSCPLTNCGLCYRLYSLGRISDSSAIQNTSTFPPPPTSQTLRSLHNASVKIIDSCPATNAANYCKMFGPAPVRADQRCGDPSTNALDVDVKGWYALTGESVLNGTAPQFANLWVWGEKVDC